jgi:hypothetical protein
MAASNDSLYMAVHQHYMELPIGDNVLAEYVWIGGSPASGMDLRCKTKTMTMAKVTSLDQFPVWNYDGSSTGQAPGKDSEVYLKPVAFYPDPFRRGNNVIVLCEAVLPDGKFTPIPTNTRRAAADLFLQKPEEVPWFGIEQEYTLFYADGRALITLRRHTCRPHNQTKYVRMYVGNVTHPSNHTSNRAHTKTLASPQAPRPSAGPRVASPAPRGPSTAPPVPRTRTAAALSRRTTARACTPASRSPA